MKNNLLLLLATLLLSTTYSCKKAENDIQKNKEKTANLNSIYTDEDGVTQIDITDNAPEHTDLTYTKIGQQQEFPFKTETIRQAWNNLSNNDITTLQPTHNYVKFTPQNE